MQERANNFQDNLKAMTMTKPAIYQKLQPVLPPVSDNFLICLLTLKQLFF